MRGFLERLPRRELWSGAALLGIVFILSAAVIWLLSSDARREIDALARANGDSMQWSLAQYEVEYRAYLNALHEAAASDAPDLQEVRTRFDIFYSRADTIEYASTFDGVREAVENPGGIAAIREYLEQSIPLIDSGDAALGASVPQLLEGAQMLRDDIRAISLAGVRAFAESTQVRRENAAKALLDLGVIVFLLLTVVFATAAVLLRMARESREQAAEISETRNRLQSIVSSSLDGIVAIDPDGRLLEFNEAAERIFGYAREEVIGASFAEVIIPGGQDLPPRSALRRYLKNGELRTDGKGLVRQTARRRDGSTFPVEISMSTTQIAACRISVLFFRDISQRVAAETELVETRDRAVQGERAKAELLAVMSHEMRTPLNGVLGTLQLLASTDLNGEQKRLVDVMDQSGQMLLEHVNNVLDISRIDAGKAAAASTDFSPVELVQNVVDGLRAQADLRGNTLDVVEVGTVAGRVSGDAARLRQILVNLLGNANKFTEHGRITVEIEAEDADKIAFRVADTGIGIAEENHARIFEDFITLDASYQRAVEGTGLGLGIVRRLAALLGGEIGVESEAGVGTVFWVRLPLPAAGDRARSEEVVATAAPCDAGPGMTVLVVEDNEINRLVLREMLERQGCAVVEAKDGKQGVQMASSRRFDLILMDVSMPRLDGVAAAKLIRTSGGPNAETRIVAATAHALAEDVEGFLAAGMEDVLTKPLVATELCRVLRGGPRREAAAGRPVGNASELVATLGSEQAQSLRRKAREEIGKGLSDIQALLASGVTQGEIAGIAHKLAGSAGIVGLDGVQSELVEIENAVAADSRHLRGLVSAAERALERAETGG